MKGQRQMNQILMRLALYIPVLGLGMGILFADSSPAATAYTLKDLCRLAARDAEQIQISREDVEIARQDRTRALSVLIPRATAFGSMKRSRESDFYNPDTLSHGIQLNQSFTLNGKEIIALKVAEATIEEKNFILKAVTDAYLFNVIDSFFRILTSRRMLEIARADVRRLEKHRNAVSKKLKVGEITRTALYRAEAELSGAGTDLVRAENGLKLARASLKSLVTLDRDFTLSQEGLEAFRRFLPSLEDVKDKALNQRPEIQSALKTLEIARKNIRYNKSAYWPSVALEGRYSKNRAEYSMPVEDVLNFETTSIAATLNFTLFDGGLRSAEILQALARERQALESLKLIKKQVELEAEEAWLAYNTAGSVLTTLNNELKSARENYKAVEMQFRYGMADSVDMMDANTLLVTTERKLSEADYSLTHSILKIIRTQGEIGKML